MATWALTLRPTLCYLSYMPRKTVVRIRFSAEELEKINELRGYETMSSYIRRKVTEPSEQAKDVAHDGGMTRLVTRTAEYEGLQRSSKPIWKGKEGRLL